jgi:hypothetical protein
MTDNEVEVEVAKFDGDGNEILGSLEVVKVVHDEGATRPYHLELNVPEHLTGELVKYGSEIFGNIDLLSAGIRGALIEALAREKGM